MKEQSLVQQKEGKFMTNMAEEAKEMETKEEAGEKMTTQAETAPTPLSEAELKNVSAGVALVASATATTFA